MIPNDPFPPSEFDDWAEDYDQSTQEYTNFPFAGYEQVLKTVLSLADPKPGMSVLDLGSGTANLALLFDQQGCELTCTDFSERMLDKARAKLPRAHFALHDLRDLLNEPSHPSGAAGLAGRFERIVSAYVFHHFELDAKVKMCQRLLAGHLAQGGRLIIADLSFATFAEKETFKLQFDDWEEEFYWFADEAVAALKAAGLKVSYRQVSPCAGVYTIYPEPAD